MIVREREWSSLCSPEGPKPNPSAPSASTRVLGVTVTSALVREKTQRMMTLAAKKMGRLKTPHGN